MTRIRVSLAKSSRQQRFFKFETLDTSVLSHSIVHTVHYYYFFIIKAFLIIFNNFHSLPCSSPTAYPSIHPSTVWRNMEKLSLNLQHLNRFMARYKLKFLLKRPASWSSGQGLCLLIMRSRVRFPVLPWEFFLAGKDSRGDHGMGN